MRKNCLAKTGLSMSQAQSISNLCDQNAGEITKALSKVNNYQKTVDVATKGTVKTVITVAAVKMPENVVAMLLEKAKLHACQGFLMENIKAKDDMLKEIKSMVADTSSVVFPEQPKMVKVTVIPEVTEEFGWEQLTASEIAKYTEALSYASHIGLFIHGGSVLDKLRKELPTIPSVEWMEVVDGRKTPVMIDVHHKAEDLLKIHEEFAELHRKYEQDVNYFKAKVKNLTTMENSRIAKLNSDAQIEAEQLNNKLSNDYYKLLQEMNEKLSTIRKAFEIERQQKIKEVAAMRIQIDPRFQETVNKFLVKLEKEDNE